MRTWQSETGKYLPRLEALNALLAAGWDHPSTISHGPVDETPSILQGVTYRAVTFYELGLWARTNETVRSILCLWKEGYLSAVGPLVRLIYELWSTCEYQTATIVKFQDDGDFEKFALNINRLFEGVRSDVLMPWGHPASEKPIHVMDTIRHLTSVFPDAESTYHELCESSHANQPRFLEWWLTGRLGGNWTNETVQTRGHALLEQTVTVAELAVRGTTDSVSDGLERCREIYESEIRRLKEI